MTTINLGHVVDRFAGPVTVTRYPAAVRVAGFAAPAAGVAEVIQAVILPAGGRVRDLAPEGVRERVAFQAFTTAAISSVDRNGQTPADTASWGGQTFEVWTVADYVQHGGYHHALLLAVP